MSKNKSNNFRLNVKNTWKYIKQAKWNLFGYGLVSVFEAVISAILPFLTAKVILNITNGAINQLIYASLAVFCINLIIYVAYFLKSLFYQRIYQKTLVGIQKSIAREILNLEVQEIDKNTSGLFIDRLNKDTTDIAGLFMEYTYWLSYILTNVSILVTLFILNKYMFVYGLITAIVVYLIDRRRLSKQYEVQKELKVMQESKTGFTSELVRGIRDVKVLNANDMILKQTTEKIEEVTKEQLHIMNIRNLYGYIENNVRNNI